MAKFACYCECVQVWHVMSLLHYTVRFRLYGQLKVALSVDNPAGANPLLVGQVNLTIAETKKIMRRISKVRIWTRLRLTDLLPDWREVGWLAGCLYPSPCDGSLTRCVDSVHAHWAHADLAGRGVKLGRRTSRSLGASWARWGMATR
jgi:hypothetical protein